MAAKRARRVGDYLTISEGPPPAASAAGAQLRWPRSRGETHAFLPDLQQNAAVCSGRPVGNATPTMLGDAAHWAGALGGRAKPDYVRGVSLFPAPPPTLPL